MTTKPKANRAAATLVQLGACEDAVQWVRDNNINTLAEGWSKCRRGDWLLWFAGKLSGPVDSLSRRKLVGAAAACARLVLPIFERRYPDDNRVRACLDCCDRYVTGKATLDELWQARSAATTTTAASATTTAAYATTAAAAATATYAATVAYATATYAAYAAAATDDARTKMLARCADEVRKHYPLPPKRSK